MASLEFLLIGAIVVGIIFAFVAIINKWNVFSSFITGILFVIVPAIIYVAWMHPYISFLYYIVMMWPGIVTAIKFKEKNIGSPIKGFFLAFCVPGFGWLIMSVVARWGEVDSNNVGNGKDSHQNAVY